MTWYSNDPENGVLLHNSAEEAETEADARRIDAQDCLEAAEAWADDPTPERTSAASSAARAALEAASAVLDAAMAAEERARAEWKAASAASAAEKAEAAARAAARAAAGSARAAARAAAAAARAAAGSQEIDFGKLADQAVKMIFGK